MGAIANYGRKTSFKSDFEAWNEIMEVWMSVVRKWKTNSRNTDIIRRVRDTQ